ncbi:MAG TPA: helix-turn-helix domain-containing protein [Solirubrobacteraceae bacterium]|nr:helix-turn-helix domain-containing protein [Solirubrobacteraceae bacterium]
MASIASGQTVAMRVVGRLAAHIEGELDVLTDRVVERIRDEIPDFRRLAAGTLRRAVRGNVARALTALRELRAPTPRELEAAAAVGRERAEQGLTIDAVLHAYRISVTAVWSRFGELARERGADVASVLAFSETLWVWADAVMDVVSAAHREVELQIVREQQQRRDAFVLALLTGSADEDELRRDAAAHGLDPDRAYVPFRARSPGNGHAHAGTPPRRVALALAGDGGLAAAFEHDLVGVALRPPLPIEGVVAGIGPAGRPAELAPAFLLAGRALETALAFGQEGVFALADLSIRPAILRDDVLGDAFVARYLRPLAALGRLGGQLEATLRAWFDEGMRNDETARALHVHPNTLRHRLRRFEEATGASLRRQADLTELWWALERSRLRRGGGEGGGRGEGTAGPREPGPH